MPMLQDLIYVLCLLSPGFTEYLLSGLADVVEDVRRNDELCQVL